MKKIITLLSFFLLAAGCNSSRPKPPEVSELTALLHAHNLTGAIIEELDSVNYEGHLWAIKATGETSLIASYELRKRSGIFGEYKDFNSIVQLPESENSSFFRDKGILHFPPQLKNQLYDLTSLFPSLHPAKFWIQNPNAAYGRFFSPDGSKYVSIEPSPITKVVLYTVTANNASAEFGSQGVSYMTQNGLFSNPVVLKSYPQDRPEDAFWVQDSKALILISRKGLFEKYDVQSGKFIVTKNDFPPAAGILDYIPDNTYIVSRLDGTFAITDKDGNYSANKILPLNIKLLGLIH